jgi:hypothetical protein
MVGEDHLRDALDDEIDDEQEGDGGQPGSGIAEEQDADDDRQTDRDHLQPEIGHALRTDQADPLDDAACDEHPAEQLHHGDRGEYRVDEGEHAADDHQATLDQVPE